MTYLYRIPLRTLVIDDVWDDAQMVLHELQHDQYWFVDAGFAAGLAEIEAALKAAPPDVILCDCYLVGFTWTDVLELGRRHAPLAPLILLSGYLSRSQSAAALASGASAFVDKTEVRGRLSVEIGIQLERTRQRAATESLRRETDSVLADLRDLRTENEVLRAEVGALKARLDETLRSSAAGQEDRHVSTEN